MKEVSPQRNLFSSFWASVWVQCPPPLPAGAGADQCRSRSTLCIPLLPFLPQTCIMYNFQTRHLSSIIPQQHQNIKQYIGDFKFILFKFNFYWLKYSHSCKSCLEISQGFITFITLHKPFRKLPVHMIKRDMRNYIKLKSFYLH